MKKKFLLLLAFVIFVGQAFPQSNNDVIMLSDLCLFLGKKSYLKPGVYQSQQLGVGNDRLSSFHIPSGMALQVFENDRYFGRSETFYSSSACLSSSWNNKVSSIKIYLIRDPNNQEGNPGNNLPPQGSNVIFYRDMKYSGMAREAGGGNFGSGTLGFLTDNISSIYIPPGYAVRLSDKSGNTQTFSISVSNLAQYGWDNKINAGFIDVNYNGGGDQGGNLPVQGDRVIFYKDGKYTGMAKEMNQGNFSANDLGFLSQNSSSIYVPAGQSVKVYDQRGNYRTFSTSVSNLAQYGWDDKIYTGIISSGGGALPPQGARVIFYRDMKYSGMSKDFNQGNFGSGSLGFLTNNISSIYIPQGWSVILRTQGGEIQTFNTSISNLAQYNWDNRIYSGFIKSNNGGQQGGNNGGGNNEAVNIFNDANYQGSNKLCGEGPINNIGFGLENNITSIKIPAGWAVAVYDAQNLTGQTRTFTSSVLNLAQYGWNDRISSVYVYRR